MTVYTRGTKTDRYYTYAGYVITWNGETWVAKDNRPGQGFKIVATGRSIKAVREQLQKINLAENGPRPRS